MGEFDLLRHVYEANDKLTLNVIVPPGDDLGVIRVGGQDVLLGVDQLVAGRHVDLKCTPLELVGRKAITRCLSDVAAMAARPAAMLAAVTLPANFGDDAARELFHAMQSTAAHYDAPLIGGDIAIHLSNDHPLTCAVTVLATSANDQPVGRGGAKVGDGVYVTGHLGGSVKPDGSGRHLTFEPRIEEALELLNAIGRNLHSMIDISDGLGRDAGHIAEMSNTSIKIDAAAIPCADGIVWNRAASDGEDYELLFTAGERPPDSLNGVPVTRIGTVEAHSSGSPRVVIVDGATSIDAGQLGWEHGAATAG